MPSVTGSSSAIVTAAVVEALIVAVAPSSFGTPFVQLPELLQLPLTAVVQTELAADGNRLGEVMPDANVTLTPSDSGVTLPTSGKVTDENPQGSPAITVPA